MAENQTNLIVLHVHRMISSVFKKGDRIFSFLMDTKFRLNFTDSTFNAVKGTASFSSCQQMSHSNGRTKMKKAELNEMLREDLLLVSDLAIQVFVSPPLSANTAVILRGHDNRSLNMLHYNLRQILSHLIHFRKGTDKEPKLTITMGLALRAKNRRVLPRGPLQLIPSVYLILRWVGRKRKKCH